MKIFDENSPLCEVNFNDIYLYTDYILTESFIDKYSNSIYWDYTCQFQKLSEALIEKHQDKVNWGWVSAKQILSEAFIEKFQDKVWWAYISREQNLSNKFIQKYQHLLNLSLLKINKHLDQENIKTLLEKIDLLR